MTKREHFLKILAGESESCGFWHGRPRADALPRLCEYFGVPDDFSLGLLLGDDVCWIWPEAENFWPDGELFDFLNGKPRTSLGESGIFSDMDDLAQVDEFPWPDASRCDFSKELEQIHRAHDAGLAVLSGIWAPFFHDVANAFGMEEYFIRMHTDPEMVHAVTRRVVDFYLAANEILLSQANGAIDAYFFGNDYGSQLDLLISPDCFREFLLPYVDELIAQAKRFGCRIVTHSCGAISRVIPDLIQSGVELLHPIQAKARGMDAQSLQDRFAGQIRFMGGIDVQHLLTYGTPQEVAAEVHRVTSILGPNYIISPSHECILPNVPPENLEALALAAKREREGSL